MSMMRNIPSCFPGNGPKKRRILVALLRPCEKSQKFADMSEHIRQMKYS